MIVALTKLPDGDVDDYRLTDTVPPLHLNTNRAYAFSPGGPCIYSLLVRLLDGPFTGSSHLPPI